MACRLRICDGTGTIPESDESDRWALCECAYVPLSLWARVRLAMRRPFRPRPRR